MWFVLVLLALVLAVVLAVQNASVVTLSVFAWQLQASLAVIIVLCFVAGAIVATAALLPGIYRHRSGERRLQARVTELERAETESAQRELSVEPPQPGM